MFHGRISLNLVLLLLLVNILSGFRLKLINLSLIKSIRSSLWFSAPSAASIVHRNHFFFHLYQKDKSSESEAKFRQASNRRKRILKAAKLAYANKTKGSITSQKLGPRDFRQIANKVLNKGKSALPPLFNCTKMLSSASDKANCLLKTFLRTLILMTRVSLYLFSLLELI